MTKYYMSRTLPDHRGHGGRMPKIAGFSNWSIKQSKESPEKDSLIWEALKLKECMNVTMCNKEMNWV